MYRFHLPRQGGTWALRLFPQLLCMESILQGAQRFLGVEAGTLQVDRLRFTGAPRPGDSLLVKLLRSDPQSAPANLSVEIWIHHRMVAQGHLSAASNQN
jgi:hypothetical protein